MITHIVHPFEKAGLGVAPFSLTGVTEKWFSIPGVPEATKPGSCCDFCYTGIAYEFWIRSADGKKFKVGSECVRKTNDAALISATERAEATLKLNLRHAKEAARIATAQIKLEDPTVQTTLSSMPHPYTWQAAKGLTRLDWATWMMTNAGNKGKIDVAKFLSKLPKIGLDTQILQEEAIKLATTKTQYTDSKAAEENTKQTRNAEIKIDNDWVVTALVPHAGYSDFVSSVIRQLNVISFRDLSPRQKAVVAEIIAKEAGRKGSNPYTQKFDATRAKLD